MNLARSAAGVFAVVLTVVVVVAVKPSVFKAGLRHDNVSVSQPSLQEVVSSVDEDPAGAMATAMMVARLATYQASSATEVGATIEPTYAIAFLNDQDDVKFFTPTTAEETQYAQWESQHTPAPDFTVPPPNTPFSSPLFGSKRYRLGNGSCPTRQLAAQPGGSANYP